MSEPDAQLTPPAHNDSDLNARVTLLLEREKELSTTKLRLEHIIDRNLVLQQISQFLISNQDMNVGLQHATRAVVVDMSFERSLLVLRVNGVLTLVASCGYSKDEEQWLAAFSQEDWGHLFAVVRTANKGEYIDTPEDRTRYGEALLERLNLLTFLSAPLQESGEVSGFLLAGYSKAQEPSYRENLLLSNQDSLWFSALANQMSAMITNAKLIASLQDRTVKLNHLSQQLAAANQDLEMKVEKRTEQLKQNVDELLRARAKDDAIIAGMGEGLLTTDNAGTILLMNGAAETILGLAQNTSLGKRLNDLLQLADDQGAVVAEDQFVVAQAIKQRQKMVQSFSFTKENGAKISVGITATPIIQPSPTGSGDSVIGSIAIVRDITKEKEVDRMKTEFISLASHQLRTPLSAIKWFSEMLLEGDAGALNAEQNEFAKNIAGSTERMLDLVNSILNISRIESGRIIIDPKPTNLEELVQGIVNDLKAKIEERQQNLVISVHKDLPQINLDPRLIGQVYLNLLTNAIKYTPKGGEISVFISRKDDQIISQVTDNGYGIPKAEQGKLFQKFFRATNAVKVETDGTGLGMYLLKAIIESSGGKIWFQSEENKGSTFWFSLPMTGMQPKQGEVTLDVTSH